MSQFTRMGEPIPQIFRVEFSIPANTPVGTEILGNVISDPKLPARQEVFVPATEVWHVLEIYAEASGDVPVEGYLDLYVNDLKQNLRFGPLGQTLRTLLNPVRLRSAIVIRQSSKIVFAYQNRVASGASATTVRINVEIMRIPVG